MNGRTSIEAMIEDDEATITAALQQAQSRGHAQGA